MWQDAASSYTGNYKWRTCSRSLRGSYSVVQTYDLADLRNRTYHWTTTPLQLLSFKQLVLFSRISFFRVYIEKYVKEEKSWRAWRRRRASFLQIDLQSNPKTREVVLLQQETGGRVSVTDRRPLRRRCPLMFLTGTFIRQLQSACCLGYKTQNYWLPRREGSQGSSVMPSNSCRDKRYGIVFISVRKTCNWAVAVVVNVLDAQMFTSQGLYIKYLMLFFTNFYHPLRLVTNLGSP